MILLDIYITGNLDIINNTQLRDLISKRPKYRESPSFTWKYNFKLVMDAIEDYARTWAKQEDVEIDTLSEWSKSIRTLVKRRLYILSTTMSTKAQSVFSNPDVIKTLNSLHERFVVVPADKAANNVVLICKTYYYQCLVNELGINGTNINSTYEHTTLSKEDILSNHKSVINIFGISMNDKNYDLPYMYWTPKLHVSL